MVCIILLIINLFDRYFNLQEVKVIKQGQLPMIYYLFIRKIRLPYLLHVFQ
jgi:hypothetical protein